MSYSTLKINIDSVSECTTALDYDTNNIYDIVVKQPQTKIIKNIIVENNYISNIVICEEYDFCNRETILYIAYHHHNDPSIYKVLIDVYKYLEQLEKEVAK